MVSIDYEGLFSSADLSGLVYISLAVIARLAWSWVTGFSVSVLLHALNSV